MMKRSILSIFTGMVGLAGAIPALAAPQKEVWMMPPGPGPQEPPSTVALRDFLLHPDDWKQTRAAMTAKTVGVFGSTIYKMNKALSHEEIHQLAGMLKNWNIKFGLEVESVKGDSNTMDTGQKAFDSQVAGWDAMQKDGMPIYSFAMDEPYCSLSYAHQPMEYAVTETANFIALLRQRYPDAQVGDIEPIPSIFAEEKLLAWVDALQAKLKSMHVRGIDFFRIDFDWTHTILNDGGSWRGIRQIELGCRQRGVPFSLVYWAPPFGFYQRMGLADDSLWYTFVMYQGYAYALVNGDPDQYVLESWIGTPSRGTPETDPDSFSRSVLDFCRKFVDKPHPPSGL